MATRAGILSTKTRAEEPCPCGCAPCEEPCCSLDCLVKPRFFCGQLLTDQDLTSLVTWTGDKFRLNRYRDGWGVICGLEVRCDPKRPGGVMVGPGYAFGCCGDDILVCEDQWLDLTGACGTEGDPCVDPRSPYAQDHPTVAQPAGLGGKGRLLPTAVDVYLGYAEYDAEPQTALGRTACGEAAGCEYGRTQERSKIWWKPAGAGADPVAELADRWEEGYQACLTVIRELRSRFGTNVSEDGEAVKRWLLDRLDRYPMRQFCVVRSLLCDQDVVTEELVANVLFWIAQDCRNAFLTCSCFVCEPGHGVRVARVWVRQTEEAGRNACRVVEVDGYPPYRRNLGLDCWPSRLGQVNLGRFIWHRWEEVCAGLAELGLGGGGYREATIPVSIDELEQLLGCSPFADCGDRPVAQVIMDQRGNRRVIGFCGAEATKPDDQDTSGDEYVPSEDEYLALELERHERGEADRRAKEAASKARRKRSTRAGSRRTTAAQTETVRP